MFFRGICSLHLQGQRKRETRNQLKKATSIAYLYEMSVNSQLDILDCIPEDRTVCINDANRN
jgi:hypothetical protein